MKYFVFPSEDSPLALIILRETNPAVLVAWSYSEEWEIRYLVAKNHNTSPNTLERLSKDEDGDVRDAVAKNPNTPTHIKKYLNELEQVRMLKEVTNPETLDSLTFLHWLEVADVDQLEAFGQREKNKND